MSRTWRVLVIISAVIVSGWNAPSEATTNKAIGSVKAVHSGYGTPPDANRERKYQRDSVAKDELLETSPSGDMRVRFVDGTDLTVGGNSAIIVDELCFDPDTKGGNAVINLAAGTFFYVSGKLPKENISIQTPVATIGIRGTELAITVNPDGTTVVGVVSGAAAVSSKTTGKTDYIAAGKSVGINKYGRTTGPIPGVNLTRNTTVDRRVMKAVWKSDKKIDIITAKAKDLVEKTLASAASKIGKFARKGTAMGTLQVKATLAKAAAKINRINEKTNARIDRVRSKIAERSARSQLASYSPRGETSTSNRGGGSQNGGGGDSGNDRGGNDNSSGNGNGGGSDNGGGNGNSGGNGNGGGSDNGGGNGNSGGNGNGGGSDNGGGNGNSGGNGGGNSGGKGK